MAKTVKDDTAKKTVRAEDLKRVIKEAVRLKQTAAEYTGQHGAYIKNSVENYGLDRMALTMTMRFKGLETARQQAVMRAFGLPANRCSNNPEALRLHQEARLRRGGVKCTCGCPDGDIILTAGQALKLATGRAMYGCRKCRQPVVPIKP